MFQQRWRRSPLGEKHPKALDRMPLVEGEPPWIVFAPRLPVVTFLGRVDFLEGAQSPKLLALCVQKNTSLLESNEACSYYFLCQRYPLLLSLVNDSGGHPGANQVSFQLHFKTLHWNCLFQVCISFCSVSSAGPRYWCLKPFTVLIQFSNRKV